MSKHHYLILSSGLSRKNDGYRRLKLERRAGLPNGSPEWHVVRPELVDMYQSYYIDHHNNVSALCYFLALKLGLKGSDIQTLLQAALLHDIGKTVVPEEVLLKKGRLTQAERKEIEIHSFMGSLLLDWNGFSEEICETVRYHHERWDGSGYPDRLKGEEIPYLSRILSVCDSFEAMTTMRHYKLPLSLNRAFEELARCSGTQFDPQVVDVFIPWFQNTYNKKKGEVV